MKSSATGARPPPREPALGLVERDPVEPRGQLCPALEAIQPAPGPDENLLSDLLGLLGGETEVAQRAIDTVGMSLHYRLKRPGIADTGALDQVGLGQ